jgi:hypothetical protein
MNERVRSLAIRGLRGCVGLMVLRQSRRLAFEQSAGRGFAPTGLPPWIRPALGGAEIVAAVLFLLPITTALGGYVLPVIFFRAAVLHVLPGWYDVSALVVYLRASLAHRSGRIRSGREGQPA